MEDIGPQRGPSSVAKIQAEVKAVTRELQASEPSIPICPICLEQMQQQNYEGYYDEFSYWSCACEHFPNGETWQGKYA